MGAISETILKALSVQSVAELSAIISLELNSFVVFLLNIPCIRDRPIEEPPLD